MSELYYSLYNPYTSELYHHGIKGQKWGVRNYQTNDGSWTQEGLERRRENYRPMTAKERLKDVGHSIKNAAYDVKTIARVGLKAELAALPIQLGTAAIAGFLGGVAAPLTLAGYAAGNIVNNVAWGTAMGGALLSGQKFIDGAIKGVREVAPDYERHRNAERVYQERHTRRVRESTYSDINKKYGKDAANKYADSFKGKYGAI